MKISCKSQNMFPLLSILILGVVALLVSACVSQPPDTSAASTPTATPTSQVKSTATAPATATKTTTTSTGNAGSSVPLTSILMVSQSIGWAVAQKTTILRTTDGGNDWTNVTPHYNGTSPAIVPTFADGQHAWIAYESVIGQNPITILRTSNGGQSWQSSTISPNEPAGVVALQFRGSNYQLGWLMVGIDGGPGAGSEAFGLYYTQNSGQSWSALPSIYTSDQVTGLSFLNTTTGFLAHGGPYSTPQLSVTHDAGHSWKALSLPAVSGLPQEAGQYTTTPPVFFGSLGFLPVYLTYDTSAGKTVQGFVIYVTYNSGATWTARNYSTFLAIGTSYSDLYIVDQTHAYVTNQQGATFLSTNGGVTWAKLSGTVGTTVSSLSFTDSQHGWAAGGGLWRTTNGGNSWQKVSYTIQ